MVLGSHDKLFFFLMSREREKSEASEGRTLDVSINGMHFFNEQENIHGRRLKNFRM